MKKIVLCLFFSLLFALLAGCIKHPVMYIDATSLYLEIREDSAEPEKETHNVGVYNDGGGTLHWKADANAKWLTVSPTEGMVEASDYNDVTLAIDVSTLLSLPVGVKHIGQFIFTNMGDNSTHAVTCTAYVIPQERVLVIRGHDPDSWLTDKFMKNIAEEAMSDFRSLGYTPTLLKAPGSADLLREVRKTPQPVVLVVVAHGRWKFGDNYGEFCTQGRKIGCVKYTDLPKGGRWGKIWDYVFLHACWSYNPDSKYTFPYPTTTRNYVFWKGEVPAITVFLWQWRYFPSEGPHDGDYELIDIEAMSELTAEETSAFLSIEEIDIPYSAEASAKEAFILLATAHNRLIQENEVEARELIYKAIALLLQAYDEGWDLARNIAAELNYVVNGSEGYIDITDTELPTGTPITDQFSHLGIVFRGADWGSAYIVDDDGIKALSGVLDSYQGPITITFAYGNVNYVEIDAGIFDEKGLTTAMAYDDSGQLLDSISNTESYGMETLVLSANDIAYVEMSYSEHDDLWAIRSIRWYRGEIRHFEHTSGE